MLRFSRFAQQRLYNYRVPKETTMFTINDNQRQAIVNEIREIFVRNNDGAPANDFIEHLWQTTPPKNLYMMLENFTRMAQREEV
jgi:hypothetical protein